MINFILLGSGTYFDYENPEAAELTIEDIAFSLANANRFAGQCRDPTTGRRLFYSVAQHCVLMSEIVPSELAYPALFHEASEATCGDVPGPLKKLIPCYREIEKRCQAAAMRRFEVGEYDAQELKRYDLIMLATERRDLMRWDGRLWPGLETVEPDAATIQPWSAQRAFDQFMTRYAELAPTRLRHD